MKRLVLFMMCVLAMNFLNAQEEVEVSIGTDAGDYSFNYDTPFEEYNKYSITQQIYTAEEMNGNVGDITRVSFKLVYCVEATTRNVDIYMINTDKASFSGGNDWANVTDADLVYSGDVVYPGPFAESYGMAWLDIELQKPFRYNGGNLIICCNDRTGVTAKESGFANYNTEEDRAIIAKGEVEYNVNDLIFAVGSTSYSNQVKFLVGPASAEPEPATPANASATAVDESSISLTWDAAENAVSYNVYQDGEFLINVTETSYIVENLQSNTQYCFAVSSVRDEMESAKTEDVCATTDEEVITVDAPANASATAVDKSSISLTWDAAENAMSYNVYQDGEFLINVTETSYIAENLQSNTQYCFAVSSVRDEMESAKTEDVCATTDEDGIAEHHSNINIYPNPVTDRLYIDIEEKIETVAVYTLTGSLVYSNDNMNGNVINVAELANGTYVVKVKTNTAELVRRFVKK